jgi:hypothetical protein
MEKINIKINKSKIYFTPLFNKELPISYFSLLKNTYLWYNDFKEETFCLLYEFDGKVKGTLGTRDGFTIYENNILFKHELFDGFIDYGRYVLYKFKLTEELIDFKYKLLEGRYSLFDDVIKNIIIQFNRRHRGNADADHIRKILNKDEQLMQELSDLINEPVNKLPEVISTIEPEDELFSNSIIIKNIEKK